MKAIILALAGSMLCGCGITGVDIVSRSAEIVGSGKKAVESREIGEFSRIKAGESFHVKFSVAKEPSLTIEGDDNLVPLVKTEVKSGTLRIYTDENYSSKLPLLVTISGPSPVGLDLSGAAHFDAAGLESNDFEAELSGASQATLNGKLKGLTADVSGAAKLSVELLSGGDLTLEGSGSSEVKISGQTDNLTIDLSGAARADLTDLTAQEADVDTSGASSAVVNVTSKLKAKASGASHIQNRGNAAVIKHLDGAASISGP